MSDQSSAELERQAEAAREKVAGTAESIRKKLTAGQLIDEFANMFTGGDMSGAVRNLKTQVRDNPLPLVLMGAGVAWLAFGKGVSDQHSHSYGSHPSGSSGTNRPQSHADRPHTQGEHGSSMMSSATEGAKAAASSVGEAASSVAETVSGMAHNLTATADRLRHSMLTGSSHMRRHTPSTSGLANQDPLLIAALGVTVGAVVGAMLPASELEKEQIGPHAQRFRKDAEEMIDKGLDSAGRVAAKTYDALKEEADRQGLAPGAGPSLVERVGEVVRSAAQSAEDAAREELGPEGKNDRQST